MTSDAPFPRGFSTRAIRAASRAPTPGQEPTSVPIYQAATFRSRDTDELADILAGRQPGYAYARIRNPTSDALAATVAELEGAEAGHAFASGMAAIFAAVASQASSGDEVVATRALYGTTQSLFANRMSGFGVKVVPVDATDPDAVEAAFRERTRLLYIETISNPTIVVADIADLAARAHRHGVRVIVDNTFASPYLCRPIELGADLVVESATKWLSGHSDAVAGVAAGSAERIAEIAALEVDTGAIAAPLNAFLVLRGIETLAVRMERQSASALAIAELLERRSDAVRAVYYPGLPSHPQHAVARRQLRTGGGMLAVDLGTREAGRAFIDALRIPERTASLGSVHTIAVHPPSTTHRQLDAAALVRAGIAPGLVRMSVGLEDLDDLRDDVDHALDAAVATGPAAGAAHVGPLPVRPGG